MCVCVRVCVRVGEERACVYEWVWFNRLHSRANMNGCDVCSDADGGPSPVVVWGFRWLVFRLMLGAGLIKIRGTMHKKTLVKGCIYV